MECKICFEPFDSKYFIPKLLPKCGHSFCRICLERLMNKKSNVNCPVCREMTINYKDNNLPTNYSLLEIMDKSSSNEKTKNLLEKWLTNSYAFISFPCHISDATCISVSAKAVPRFLTKK